MYPKNFRAKENIRSPNTTPLVYKWQNKNQIVKMIRSMSNASLNVIQGDTNRSIPEI